MFDFQCYPKVGILTILETPRQVEGGDYETAMKSRVFIELQSSMKAMTAPRLPRPICRARKPIFLDHKQVYISIFALGFAYFILAVAS